MSKITMSWGDRFALIDHYKPSDTEICTAFELSQIQLDTARQLRDAGTMRASTTLDVSKYTEVFSGGASLPVSTVAATKVQRTGGATTHPMPETASKRIRPPQKRGRKGDKISKALLAVPTTQVPVETFMKEHGVSLAVLRQSKRFIEKLDAETQTAIGKINVRQDKSSKVLMIWREVA